MKMIERRGNKHTMRRGQKKEQIKSGENETNGEKG